MYPQFDKAIKYALRFKNPRAATDTMVYLFWHHSPNPYNPNLFPIGDGFGLLVFFKRYESTYFRNGVERKPTSRPRGPRKKKQTP